LCWRHPPIGASLIIAATGHSNRLLGCTQPKALDSVVAISEKGPVRD